MRATRGLRTAASHGPRGARAPLRKLKRTVTLVAAAACGFALLGIPSQGAADPSTPSRAAATTVTPPPVDGRFDYQIGGAYPPVRGVTVVERDRSSRPVEGLYTLCYVNAFQTQPEEARWWKSRHPDLVLKRADGGYVGDPGWPGELLLDTSTAAKRSVIAAIVGKWFDGCAAKGFRAVEPDNLDSWTRSAGRLTRADNLALARLLTARGHARGLAVAQKNTPELGRSGRDRAHFDFAVAEECQRYGECARYTAAYGPHVIEIEYTDGPRAFYTAACAARGARISVILRDRQVVPRGDAAYRFESC